MSLDRAGIGRSRPFMQTVTATAVTALAFMGKWWRIATLARVQVYTAREAMAAVSSVPGGSIWTRLCRHLSPVWLVSVAIHQDWTEL